MATIVELGAPGKFGFFSESRSSSSSTELSTSAPQRLDLPGLTVVYIHGIGGHPQPAVLKQQYDRALFGHDVGERSRLAYWADILHPEQGLEFGGMAVDEEFSPKAAVRSRGVTETTGGLSKDSTGWAERFAKKYGNSRSSQVEFAAKFLEQLETRLNHEIEATEDSGVSAENGSGGEAGFRARFLPAFLPRRQITRWLTGLFLKDVHQYLFNQAVRERIRDRLLAVIPADDRPYIIVSHSLGTVISYDVLQELARKPGHRLSVPLWITLGSPLGIPEVQDVIEHDANGKLRVPPQVRQWRNFADSLDPVALGHADLERLFGRPPGQLNQPVDEPGFQNLHSQSWSGFNPHSALGYLGHPSVREAVGRSADANFASPTSDFIVAKDVAAELCGTLERSPVLIELFDRKHAGGTLAERRGRLHDELSHLVRNNGGRLDDAKIDVLDRYISVDLNSREIALLRERHSDWSIYRVWKNARKRALLNVSIHRVQAFTAHSAYEARGEGIGWAVLDTGIRDDHPHFTRDSKTSGRPVSTIAAQWDCTRRSPLDADKHPSTAKASDLNGHGTHVAGIIAGQGAANGTRYSGVAPLTRLHVYKVLDDDGYGYDSYIIKALDHVARVNELAGKLVIHGVNLSLGGPFDASVFGCGFSPVCTELRRLWRQGVLVCLAAGNEGTLEVVAIGEDRKRITQEVNLDLSIGDPANLEDAIAVGSVNKDYPHIYGVSYFSSRGPTADGRSKPDVVAPGERIMSCNSEFKAGNPRSLYCALSGTSMACPHVSGLLAAFLSVRREFIGEPDKVKQLLMQHAIDLKRDRYHQGAGMPNLVKMLAET